MGYFHQHIVKYSEDIFTAKFFMTAYPGGGEGELMFTRAAHSLKINTVEHSSHAQYRALLRGKRALVTTPLNILVMRSTMTYLAVIGHLY